MDTQLEIARSLRDAKSSVKDAAQRSVSHLQVLDTVALRLQKMRDQLHGLNGPKAAPAPGRPKGPRSAWTVEEEIMDEIGEDPVAVAEAALSKCPKCAKLYLNAAFLAHHATYCVGADGIVAGGAFSVAQLSRNRQVRGEEGSVRCSVCGLPVMPPELEVHEDACRLQRILASRANEAMYSMQLDADVSLAPSVPAGVKLDRPTAVSIRVSWTAPIFSGGQSVYENEISYELYTFPGLSTATTTYTLLTSRWCLDYPVALEAFEITGLKPSSDVMNVKVRCLNKVGFSPWSEANGVSGRTIRE